MRGEIMKSGSLWMCCALSGAALSVMGLCAEAAQPQHASAGANPQTPQIQFGDLFIAVQSAQVFPDSKTFADAVPKSSPSAILARYHAAKKPLSKQALSEFVSENFVVPSQASGPKVSAEPVSISRHIDALWDQLTRTSTTAPRYSSLLPLPEPYVVPGGRFREMYYWDSYFTMLGLAESGRKDLLEHMVRDFTSLIDAYGHIPNGTRNYYLSRSQPPFYFAMVGLLNSEDPAVAYERYLPQLRREYAFWMQGEKGLKGGAAHRRVVAMADGSILNRYWDDSDSPRDESYREDTELAKASGRIPKQLYRDLRAAAESGWDFGSRWFADGHSLATINTTQIVPIDLNSLLFGLEEAIRAGCEHAHESACASEFAHRSAARRESVNHYLWDAAAGVYRDYNWTNRAQVTRISAATLYPLFVAMATQTQASAVATAVSRDLLKSGGIVTTPQVTGQQWDAPNGWPPLQWIGISGLRHYSITPLGDTLACRWMLGVNRVYGETGKLVEKYDVVTTGRAGGGGEYPTQDGFGWTNGVMRKLMALYPNYAANTSPQACGLPGT
jgi:alpha,alpha-trehalase